MSHILLLSRLYTNANALSSLSWRVGRSALRRQVFCDWRPLDSEITMSILDDHKVNVETHKDNNRNY